jgi:oxygen-independent coproporphyrinogen III oxidase
MSLQAKADKHQALGIYLHVPFCATTCDFCAFYQEAPDRAGVRAYLATVARELSQRPPDRPVETVFWGGGTPGLLRAEDLRALGQSLRRFLPNEPAEWSVELAPSTVKADKVAALREIGVTRVSLGVQSFDDALLGRLGRQHSRAQVEKAIALLRDGGIANLNLDLIFAVPGQSLAAWEQDLATALAVAPEHLSTYCLTFEEDTRLWARLQRGEVHRRGEVEEAAFYELSAATLEAAGFAQYEISNYAREGFACRHNLNTWHMREWLGYGPSASSQYGGRRFTAPASLEEWTRQVEDGERRWDDLVELHPALLATDALIFGLRMNAGVEVEALRARFPEAPWDRFHSLARDLAAADLLVASDPLAAPETWSLTPAGRLLADRVGLEFLEAGEG